MILKQIRVVVSMITHSFTHCCASSLSVYIGVMVEPKSWIVPIPDNTFEVRQLLVNHQLRINRNDSAELGISRFCL